MKKRTKLEHPSLNKKQQIPKLYQFDADGVFRVYPHDGQAAALMSEKRFIFALAGTQSGKTAIGPVWLWNEMKRCGPGDYMAISPSYPLQQRKLLPEYNNYFDYHMHIGKYIKSERVMKVTEPDGSEYNIFFASADNPDSLESATIKAAHLDEVGQDSFRIEAWDAILRRLSIYEGRVLATTTIYNLGWMKTEIYDKWKAGDPDIDVIQFTSIMNPTFPKKEYEKRKLTMPLWKFKMFYMGEYARPAGMIYEDYDEEIHKIKPFTIPAAWPRYVGIDPGAVNTALVYVAADEARGRFYAYRSSLDGNKTTGQHVADVKQYEDFNHVLKWMGGAKSEKQFRMDWTEAGIKVEEPVYSDVEVGIGRIIRLFKEKRLYIFDNEDNRGLFDEIGTYARVLDANAQPTLKIKDKEKFHRLDALRYVCQAFNIDDNTDKPPGKEDAIGNKYRAKEIFRQTRRPGLW